MFLTRCGQHAKGVGQEKFTADFNPPFSSFKLGKTREEGISHEINSSLLTQVFDWKMEQKLLCFFPQLLPFFSSTAFL